MFKGLKRVVYRVEDLATAREWYSRILDTAPIFDAPVASIFLIGNCSLTLLKSSNAASTESNRLEVFWEVDDVKNVFDSLIRAGATIHSEIRDALNVRTAQVVDPFGNIVGLTGSIREEAGSVEDKPSRSALTVAFCRALAHEDPRVEIRGSDHQALLFLDNQARQMLGSSEVREKAIDSLVTRPLYGFITARTHFFDRVFLTAIEEGVPQIVILGAGYDTRALRLANMPEMHTRIFEVDIPTTQSRKLEILLAQPEPISPHVMYVPFNFNGDNLVQALSSHGFDRNGHTIFIWEGVTYYLAEEAIARTLQSIRSLAATGSIVAFDYLAEETASVHDGEPFRFWISPSDLPSYLDSHGFDMVENLLSADIERKFLTLGDGRLAEPSLSRFCLAKAAINGGS